MCECVGEHLSRTFRTMFFTQEPTFQPTGVSPLSVRSLKGRISHYGVHIHSLKPPTQGMKYRRTWTSISVSARASAGVSVRTRTRASARASAADKS